MEFSPMNGQKMSQGDIDFLMVINRFDLLVKADLMQERDKTKVFPRYKDIVAGIVYRNNLGM